MKTLRFGIFLLALALLLPLLPGRAEAPMGHPALEGLEVVAWKEIRDTGWGFASVKKGDNNFLLAFEKGSHGWEERYSGHLPRGPMRFLLQDVSGTFKTVVKGKDFIFDRDRWGQALMVFWSNGEFYENQFIYELSAKGRWLLSHYAHAGQSGLVDIFDNEMVFYEAYEQVQRVKVKTERDMEKFNYFLFPRTPQRAAQPEVVPPSFLMDWFTYREIPLEGEALIPVYAAPDKNSLRAANGKAAVSPKGWAQVFGVEGEFALIQYGISESRLRVGYVESRFLPDWYLDTGLGFTRVPAQVVQAADATDDPLVSREALARLKPGQAVILLSRLGDFAYFEAAEQGKPYRAFAPLSAFDQVPQAPRPTRELAFFLEGQEQRGTFTRVWEEALGFEIWVDREHFREEALWNGFALSLQNNLLGSPVQLFVYTETSGQPALAESFASLRGEYEAEGFAVSDLAYAGELGGLNLTEVPEAFLARKGGETARAYLARTEAAAFVAVVEYPAEAAEGWGARMDFMLGTLKEVAGE